MAHEWGRTQEAREGGHCAQKAKVGSVDVRANEGHECRESGPVLRKPERSLKTCSLNATVDGARLRTRNIAKGKEFGVPRCEPSDA